MCTSTVFYDEIVFSYRRYRYRVHAVTVSRLISAISTVIVTVWYRGFRDFHPRCMIQNVRRSSWSICVTGSPTAVTGQAVACWTPSQMIQVTTTKHLSPLNGKCRDLRVESTVYKETQCTLQGKISDTYCKPIRTTLGGAEYIGYPQNVIVGWATVRHSS